MKAAVFIIPSRHGATLRYASHQIFELPSMEAHNGHIGRNSGQNSGIPATSFLYIDSKVPTCAKKQSIFYCPS